MNRSIVCGVDGTRGSRWAARVAGELARELERTLVLVYVASDDPTFPYGDPRLRELQRREAVGTATTMLERAAAAAPEAPVRTRVAFGDAADALRFTAVEEDAELLVVGSRGRGPLAGALLGSVSARLAATAPCPLLVVPSPDAAGRWLSRPENSRIVCGVDDSVPSVRAVRAAVGLASRLGLQLSLVHVDRDLERADAPHGSAPEDRAALTVVGGEPAETLREHSADPDASLLVVGSRGRTPWRAVLGTVSGRLAAHASVPVVVVPPTADSDADDVAAAPVADRGV
ncbi:MAG TPA: universal stress protein [Solirubrobacteraceae bacterium]|nr:universal stress protein [Solirubrobacteraceae bacterium]